MKNKKNILYLSGRQEGKTSFGLYWLINSIMFAGANNAYYVGSSRASLKSAQEKLTVKLARIGIEYFNESSTKVRILKKDGSYGCIHFIIPRKEDLIGVNADRFVFDDIDCWDDKAVDFLLASYISMVSDENAQIIAFVNHSDKVCINYNKKVIERVNDKDKVLFSLSLDSWEVKTFFMNFDSTKPMSNTVINNIWDAGDSLISQIQLHKNKRLEFFDKKSLDIIPLDTSKFTKYFFVEKANTDFVKHIAGCCCEDMKEYVKSTTVNERVLYGISYKTSGLEQVSKIITFNENDNIELRVAHVF